MQEQNVFDLTNPQKSIWLTEEFFKGTSINNICGTALIEEEIDFKLLEKSILMTLKKNDIFKIKFLLDGNNLKQFFSGDINSNIIYNSPKNKGEFNSFVKAIASKPFDILNSYPYNIYIIKFPNNHGGFVVNIHHILSDSWTLGLLSKEVVANYYNLRNNTQTSELPVYTYKHFIESEKQYIGSDKFEKDKAYWHNVFNTIPEVAGINPYKPDLSENKYSSKANRTLFEINKEYITRIRDFCKKYNFSLYNFFMSILAIYISGITNLDDFAIGTPILNRTNYAEKNTFGMFISTQALRLNLEGIDTFLNLIKYVSLSSFSMLKHQKYSYQELLTDLRKKDNSIPNLYNILFSYQITKAIDEHSNVFTDWAFTGYSADDIAIHVYDLNDTGMLNIAYDYKTSLFNELDVKNIHKRIINIIDQVLLNENIQINDIEIITPSEKKEILSDFNNTLCPYPENKTFVDLFEKQVKKTPKNIAVVFEDEKITFKELNEKANQLARFIVALGIKQNDVVGIMLERSIDMVIAIIATLKAGAAYLPIDMNYPDERIQYMLENSNCNILISRSDCKFDVANINLDNCILDLEKITKDDINLKILPESNSYIIYTSGSTGKPKGVALSHKGLYNLTCYCNETVEYLKNNIYRNVASITTVSFDIFIFETLISLQKGLKVVLSNCEEQVIPKLLNNLIERENIEIIQTTPSRMQLLLDNLEDIPSLSRLKFITLAGEKLSKDLVDTLKELCPECRIYNGYGPSETTVFATLTDVTDMDNISIGKALANNKIYILNKNKSLCPNYTIGEIYISGDNVGNGYLNNKELTDTVFMKDVFDNSKTMYNSGDIGYFASDGNIICLGRSDNQIKIRGQRIEVGEIENTILEFSTSIKSCVVLKKDYEAKSYLVAFYTSDEEIDVIDIKTFLRKSLTVFMIPKYFVKVDKMPYTFNGKIDKKALANLDFDVKNNSTSYEGSQKTIDIFKSVLNCENLNMSASFIDNGGDSLSAINLSIEIAKLLKIDVSVRDILNALSISDLINSFEENPTSSKKIQKADSADSYPLSSAQKRIYYASKMAGADSLLYNTSFSIMFDYIIDENKLNEAFKKLIKRHSSFRTIFVMDEKNVVQKILPDVNFELEIVHINKKDINKQIALFSKPFNFENAPLLRAKLCFINNGKTLLLIDSHHIIMDGLSLKIMFKDLLAIYNDELLPEKTIEYKDYAVWEKESFKKCDEKYWMNIFQNYGFESLNLPYDYTLPAVRKYIGEKIYTNFSNINFEKVNSFAKKHGTSPYVVFLSALFVTLYKYTGQRDLVIGSPCSNRTNFEVQDLIGTFVNNLAMRSHILPNQKVRNLLKILHKHVSNDLSHQSYPYDMLLKKLNVPSDSSLFDVVFTYQTSTQNNSLENIEINEIHTNTAKFNLTLEVVPEKHQINLEYRTDIFKSNTAKSFLNHYTFILRQLLKSDDLKIDDLKIITPSEEKILKKFNDTNCEIEKKTVSEIFEEQVLLNPNNIALICDNKKLTYLELNERANSIAHLLLQKGVKQNDIVAIMTNRSLETVICMLGILKAGAAFLNIDPTYPEERTNYYIENSNIEYVLCHKELKAKVSQIKNCIEIDLNIDEIYNKDKENIRIDVKDTDLSYIIYTSGSTGKPKGVMLNQIGLSNMVQAMTKVLDYLKEGYKHTLASVTSTPFDIFVYEILVSLTHGLKVVMANNAEHRNPLLLDDLIRKYNVDVMTVTPSLMKINYDNRKPDTALAGVKNMVFGGEPLPEKFVKDLRSLADDITIYNIYGPSEITVLCNVQNLNGEKEINVGPPIMNTHIHVLDKNMKQVPIGVTGEIYISGIQVGNGYIGKPELTDEKFLKNPFGPGKIYKSGDIGKWTFDGKLQCLGRMDNQIKLRGLRIELGEIENIISNIDGVTSSIVNKVEINGKEVLCAYFVADKKIPYSQVRSVLKASLPNYMIPTYIIQLDEMPYTINRKIDRKALPLPDTYKSLDTEKINISELDSNEEKLIHIWKSILKVPDVSVDDNFFEIGGDSISAISMQIEALKYGLQFEYADIFNFPTIKQLSDKLPSSEDSFMTKYDYSNINKILENNKKGNLITIKKFPVKNVLLIGATGYLGSHILNSFLKNETGKIYCLLRPNENQSLEVKLKNSLAFYFGENYLHDNLNRITIIKGDLKESNLGMSKSDYEIVSKDINCVINSAALVKHFGTKELFYDINVNGTKNVIDFCMKNSLRLIHASTISVSGFGEKEECLSDWNLVEGTIPFKENNLFVNQNLKGIYSVTKYQAEIEVLEAINNGLDAQILRIGNLTNRFSDGVFQRNVNENAFARRLKSYIEIGALPRELLDHDLELTPVDLCSDAIIKILEHTSLCNVIHLYNTNLLPVKQLFNTLINIGYDITPVNENLMSTILTGLLTDDMKKDVVSGIIQDITSDKKIVYTSKIALNADFSKQYLAKIGFNWPIYDESYIVKCFDYYRKIKFV